MRRPDQQRRPRRGRRQSRTVRVESLEARNLLAALPLGATALDTGEFLLGRVSVTPVFFDSTGETDPKTQHWSEDVDAEGRDEIDQVMAKLQDGLDWWVDTLDALDTKHTLEFEIDRTHVDTPLPTQYEPIDHNGGDFNLWVTEFLNSVGHGNASSIEDGVRQFNHQQRIAHATDWAFTVFIVDASEDLDERFAPGSGHRGAFAFPGGLFIVIPSPRSAAIFAHEIGHIFWAMDEYLSGHSWNQSRGYYNTQNFNGIKDNPDPQFDQQISIMLGFDPLAAAFAQNVSPASTLALVGWQDSDGDGVFDLADVPLKLDADGYFDSEAGEYHFAGTAAAVPLMNQNTEGAQSDITPGRISQIEYSLDNGPWNAAAQPDQPSVDFELSVPIVEPFSNIRWRAIDVNTGITSPVVSGTSLLPALGPASVSGVAYVDHDGGGSRDETDELLASTTVVIRRADGTPLFFGDLNAADYDDGLLPDEIPGISFEIIGEDLLPNNVGSFVSPGDGDRRVFHTYDPLLNRWSEKWTEDETFGIILDQPVGQFSLDVTALSEQSYGRLEAYDESGQLIARVTSDALAAGQTATVTVSDADGRITRIRAFGHAGSIIAMSGLSFGTRDTAVTDAQGSWSFANVPAGNYRVTLTPERVIHDFPNQTVNIQVSDGTSPLIMAAAQRVNSIRHNAQLPEDATGTDGVTARDALVIINDLGELGQRILQPEETDGFAVDVNNDGMVSALDALLVINRLGGDGEAEPAVAAAGDPPPGGTSNAKTLAPVPSLGNVPRAGEWQWAADQPGHHSDRSVHSAGNGSLRIGNDRLLAAAFSPRAVGVVQSADVDGADQDVQTDSTDPRLGLPTIAAAPQGAGSSEFAEPFDDYEV